MIEFTYDEVDPGQMDRIWDTLSVGPAVPPACLEVHYPSSHRLA